MRTHAQWTVLSFVPSALLVAVTAHIGTEIVSAPYLWVIPLVLFLASFVIVFRDHEIVSRRLLLRMQIGLTVALAFSFVLAPWTPTLIAVPLHLTAFFVAALLCHGALYARRPDATHLTGFYLWMSFGGALGGVFAALVAPHLFKTVAEYPILIVAALIARPHLLDARLSTWRREAIPILILGAVLLAPAAVLGGGLEGRAPLFFLMGLLGLAAAFIWQNEHPVRMLALATVMFALTQFYELGLSHVVYARSFFGVHKIVDFADGKARLLFHGAIVHGAERLTTNDGAPVTGRPEQLTYYYQGGPFEEAIDAARAAQGGRLTRVALVGLGVGALACSRAPGECWSIYEIDPELVRISTQSGLFRTMPTCGANMRVIVGDARLTLTDAREPFDLMILDAYSSDNIPVHLLTQEAMRLYESLLAPHGKIVMNITNRNMDLTNIVASSAHAVGLAVRDKRDRSAPDFKTTFHAAAHIAVLARDERDFGALVPENGWRPAPADPSFRTWTDDYSNVLGAILKRPSP
jgi:spermidine synthase